VVLPQALQTIDKTTDRFSALETSYQLNLRTRVLLDEESKPGSVVLAKALGKACRFWSLVCLRFQISEKDAWKNFY
jgi:hypothetical protein